MKKSIIIISLLIISSTQSCDRSDESLSSENLLNSTKKDLNLQSDSPLSAKDQDEQSIDPNNDEEPRRDKQHWRVPQDSTR